MLQNCVFVHTLLFSDMIQLIVVKSSYTHVMTYTLLLLQPAFLQIVSCLLYWH